METTQTPTPMQQVTQKVQSVTAPVTQAVKKIPKINFKTAWPYLLAGFLVILAGVGTGWLISGRSKTGIPTESAPGAKVTAKEAGIADEKSFPDTAEGVLEEGGVNGEGTHHLTRSGGASQNVYLTSTVVDLGSFVGKKVQIWGQTLSARKAGWLMDVGKVKVIE